MTDDNLNTVESAPCEICATDSPDYICNSCVRTYWQILTEFLQAGGADEALLTQLKRRLDITSASNKISDRVQEIILGFSEEVNK